MEQRQGESFLPLPERRFPRSGGNHIDGRRFLSRSEPGISDKEAWFGPLSCPGNQNALRRADSRLGPRGGSRTVCKISCPLRIHSGRLGRAAFRLPSVITWDSWACWPEQARLIWQPRRWILSRSTPLSRPLSAPAAISPDPRG